jgi:hypothetical protein
VVVHSGVRVAQGPSNQPPCGIQNGEAHDDNEQRELEASIVSLSEADVRSVLIMTCKRNKFIRSGVKAMLAPRPATQVHTTTIQAALPAAAPTTAAPKQEVDFWHYRHDVDNVFDKYSSNSGSREYENALSAVSDIQDYIKEIEEKAQESYVSFNRL